MRAPAVSVVMAVYNDQHYIATAIESILGQSLTDFEFIIVNDGSTDNTEEVIRRYSDPRITLLTNKKNLGQVRSLNLGLRRAKGMYIARIDSDDISHPQRLAKQLRYLQRHPDVVIIGSDARIIDTNGKRLYYQPTLTTDAALQRILAVTCPFFHPSVMFQRKLALDCGGYDPNSAEDYDLWERMSYRGKLANLREPLCLYRTNPVGLSVTKAAFFKFHAGVIAARRWRRYGLAGPAPHDQWRFIWPKHGKRHSIRPGESKYYAQLHIEFAKGYQARRQWRTAAQHIIGAISWDMWSLKTYFYILVLLLPYQLFVRLEAHLLDLKLQKVLS